MGHGREIVTRTKKYLRDVKKKWSFCQQIDLDVKYLKDIPEL